MVSLIKGLAYGGIGFVTNCLINGCGQVERGKGGNQHGSNLLASHSNMFSDQYEFVQLNKDGTYTAALMHGDVESGAFVKSGDKKQVSLTQSSSGKVEQRTLATAVNLKPFLDQPCKTGWKPAAGDGSIAYRTLTLKSDGTFSATSGAGGAAIGGSWLLGYTAYAKRVLLADGKASYVPMLGNAIQFKETGSDEAWSVGIATKGKRGFYLEDDATSGNTGRYPYYKIAHTGAKSPDDKIPPE